MTSDTKPSGQAFATNLGSDSYAYTVFSGFESFKSICMTNNNTGNYVGYKFTQPVNVILIGYWDLSINEANQWMREFTVDYSDDGISWNETTSTHTSPFDGTTHKSYIPVNNYGSHLYWRIRVTLGSPTSYANRIAGLQFFGRYQ